MKITKTDNYLDLIPVRVSKYSWQALESGIVQISVPRDGWLDKLVRRFKETPETMKIDLDEVGSFAYLQMDGETSIGEICTALQEAFGESIEPVYERVGTYVNILRNNGFIELKKQGL